MKTQPSLPTAAVGSKSILGLPSRRATTRWALAVALVLLAPVSSAFATTFDCDTTINGPYCVYIGPVSSIYVNDSNHVLLYWDPSFTAAYVQSETAAVGLDGPGLVYFDAAAVSIDDKPEFAKLLYTTTLAAYLSGEEVRIQMRGTFGGRLKIDRIWLKQ